jgi:hypothetical protein
MVTLSNDLEFKLRYQSKERIRRWVSTFLIVLAARRTFTSPRIEETLRTTIPRSEAKLPNRDLKKGCFLNYHSVSLVSHGSGKETMFTSTEARTVNLTGARTDENIKVNI